MLCISALNSDSSEGIRHLKSRGAANPEAVTNMYCMPVVSILAENVVLTLSGAGRRSEMDLFGNIRPPLGEVSGLTSNKDLNTFGSLSPNQCSGAFPGRFFSERAIYVH